MLIKLLLILTALLTFFRFSRARQSFDDARVPPGMALLAALSIFSLFAITVLAFYAATPITVAIAIIGMIISNYVFIQSLSALSGTRLKIAFDPQLPTKVVNGGIYARIRHPMYTAYILFWISYAVGSADWRSAPLAILIVSTYTFLALSEERRMLASANKDSYLHLKSHTGMFWPKIL